MGSSESAYAYFRIAGEYLPLEDISSALGMEPTESWRKGDPGSTTRVVPTAAGACIARSPARTCASTNTLKRYFLFWKSMRRPSAPSVRNSRPILFVSATIQTRAPGSSCPKTSLNNSLISGCRSTAISTATGVTAMAPNIAVQGTWRIKPRQAPDLERYVS